MTKEALRCRLAQIRANISRREEKDASVFRMLMSLISATASVFSYVSFGTEVDTHAIIAHLRERHRMWVPHTVGSEMHAVPLGTADVSCVDKRGNAIPAGDDFEDGQADAILVPLLGFDARNYRIGYGAGCYDRYFARHSGGRKIGLAYDEQFCAFAHESTDIPLDVIVTPTKILRRNI